MIVTFYLPLFHLIPLKEAEAAANEKLFEADTFVENWWRDHLLPSVDQAIDVRELISAFSLDTDAAIERYGHRLGVSSKSSYFISGNGKIIEVDRRSVSIDVDEDGDADVVINTGPVFGNTVRDGSGLLDINQFPDSQDFNAISVEINRRIEERVLTLLKEGTIQGREVQFVGGVDIAHSNSDLSLLKVVPVMIMLK